MPNPSSAPLAPKEAFSALDTLALARELRHLGKVWFDKAYSLPEGRLLLTLKVQGQGRSELLVVPGKLGLLRPITEERPDEPGRLAVDLRRHLTGAPLLEVVQPGGERYLELTFGQGGEEAPAMLALELFGQGNVVLVRDGKIAALLHTKVWAGRVLRPGSPYGRPPPRKDPFQLTAGEVLGLLTRSKTDLVSTLAARFGLGGPLAEEVLARAGLDGRAPAATGSERAADRLVPALAALLADIADPPAGFVYRRAAGGTVEDVTPFRSARWQALPGRTEERLERFSDATALFLAELGRRTPAPPSPVEQARSDRRAELERLVAQQRATVEELENAMEADRSAAELLLSHYEEAQAALEAARSAGPAAEEAVEVEIAIGDRRLRVAAWRPLRESAQALFEAAKRRLPKLEGARKALDASQEGLRVWEQEASARAQAAESARTGAAADAARTRPWTLPRKKHFWFEKAPRWLVTASGLIAVSGRDAKSNDAVVKRYLRERDVYAHADLQGAPSVVVKSPAPGQGEIGAGTLREICQWGVACSKAWRAGLASADGFWVQGDQVSKAGASGEFVPRGSWVIHGTRHFERDLPIELLIGTVEHEGTLLLQMGPRASFQGPGRRPIWVLTPGDEREREPVERQVAQDLGVSRERVQLLFPPGGVRAQRA